jgi:parallel beta-helix repeat protein
MIGIHNHGGSNNIYENNTANNNNVVGFIVMESGINNQVINNTANYNPEGFTVIDTGNYNNLTGNTANFNTRVGFHLGEFWVGAGAAEYNNLINNTAYGIQATITHFWATMLRTTSMESTSILPATTSSQATPHQGTLSGTFTPIQIQPTTQ